MEHDVCPVDEIPDGGRKAMTVGGEKVLLLRTGDEVLAISSRCPHMKLPLSFGTLEGDQIKCMFHGSCWNVRTGERVKKAWLFGSFGDDHLPTWPASVREGRIWVEVP